MLSDVATMVLVLGGTLLVAVVLLYFSLLPGAPPRTQAGDREKRLAAAATTGLIASARDNPDN